MGIGDAFLDGAIRMNSYSNRMEGQKIFGQRLMEMYRERDLIKNGREIEEAKQEATKSFERNLEWYNNLIKEDKNV